MNDTPEEAPKTDYSHADFLCDVIDTVKSARAKGLSNQEIGDCLANFTEGFNGNRE